MGILRLGSRELGLEKVGIARHGMAWHRVNGQRNTMMEYLGFSFSAGALMKYVFTHRWPHLTVRP